jgi:hypothetical protein
LHDGVKIGPKWEELGGNRPPHCDAAGMSLAPAPFELEAITPVVERFPGLLRGGVKEAVEDFVGNMRTTVREAPVGVERGECLELLRRGLDGHGKGAPRVQERHTTSESPLMYPRA